VELDFSALAGCGNVHWLGFQAFADRPRWLRREVTWTPTAR